MGGDDDDYDDDTLSLRECLVTAEKTRHAFDNGADRNSPAAQATLAAAIAGFEQCLQIASDLAIFSPNEDLDDISSGNLQYLLLHFHIAELKLQRVGGSRKHHLSHAAASFDSFLHLLDTYRILSKNDVKLYERYQEDPRSFLVATTTDAAARRETKIARFKEEKTLKQKIEYLRTNPHTTDNEESVLRQLHLTEITLRAQQTFQHLDSISQELQILALAPPSPPSDEQHQQKDQRQRGHGAGNEYSDRLDAPLSQLLANGNAGPILGQDGRPLRPFTLLDTRQRVRQGVFGPDHSLPTMTIDEYLEEEKRRGGMIDGGGPQSQAQEQVDEDDMDKADEATMKARRWDEYVEENPKGAGNTMNMG